MERLFRRLNRLGVHQGNNNTNDIAYNDGGIHYVEGVVHASGHPGDSGDDAGDYAEQGSSGVDALLEQGEVTQ